MAVEYSDLGAKEEKALTSLIMMEEMKLFIPLKSRPVS